MSTPQLTQFQFSHFNEKIRWALDYKGIPHTRRSVLPGLHIPGMILRTGQRQTPALRLNGRTLTGSARILDALEAAFPSPALFPTDAQANAEVRALNAWIDEDIGAAARRAFFFDFLEDGGYAADVMSTGQAPWVRSFYRVMFPGTKAIMRLDMKIFARECERGREILDGALTRVVERAGVDGYLVGDGFTAADLTAASILQVAALPEEFPVKLPRPLPPGAVRWLARWQDHPGVAWVRSVYRRHRGVSVEIVR